MRRLVLLLVLVACSKRESVATTEPIEASAPVNASASTTASAAARAVAEAAPSLEQELVSLAARWNAALATRDADKLGDVYGARVRLYGTDVDRAAAIRGKKAAFGADYTQSIGAIAVDASDAARPRATFDKTWKQRGKESNVRASLAFAKEGGRWVVVEESDAKTDALAKQRAEESCLGLVHQAVLSTDDGATYKKEPYGTMYVCGPPDCDTFQIAAVRFGDDGMTRQASFDVDQKTGVVSHAGIALKPDVSIVARMKSACAREAAQGK